VRAVAILLLVASTLLADAETAAFFLTRAESAMNARQYDKAKEFIERSLAEEEGYLPALVMKARLAGAQNRSADAVRILEAVVARKSEARGSVEGRAIREAEQLLANLDAAQVDYNKLLKDYVEKLLALAHESKKRKPRLAIACYQQVLAVQPDNAEALQQLKGDGDAEVKAVPKKRGESLLNGRNLNNWSASAPSWTYKDKVLHARLDGVAQVVHCRGDVSGNFEYICELRFVEKMGKDPLIGLLIGGRGDYDHFGVWIFADSIRLERQTQEGVRSEYARKAVSNLAKGFTRNDWHTYRVVHKAKRITVFVDGVELYSSAAADRLPEGWLGLWAQDARIEIRRVAVVR